MDLSGTTPLGWASFRLEKRPPPGIEQQLFSPGDRSILPLTPTVRREGSSWRPPGTRTAARTARLVLYGFSEAGGWRPAMEDRSVSASRASLVP